MTTRIRRWVETDTGHRVPNHKSKCCHLHGHRYRWEAEIEGDTIIVSNKECLFGKKFNNLTIGYLLLSTFFKSKFFKTFVLIFFVFN